MKLLKSKKGFDWAFLIVGVVILCLVFLYIQLDKKMGAFDTPIGQMQMDLIDKIYASENALFYLDQSGRLAACDAVYELGKKGGFSSSPPCGQTAAWPHPDTLEPVAFNYWVKDGRNCYEGINFYREFAGEFRNELFVYLNRYNFAAGETRFLQDNYEFMITDKKVVGSAIKNIELEFVSTGSSIGIGKYSFKPSFAVDFNTGISDYLELGPVVADLVACRAPMSECMKSINTPGLVWSFQALGPADYLLTVEQDIDCRFKGQKPKIMFAIEKPIALPEVPVPVV